MPILEACLPAWRDHADTQADGATPRWPEVTRPGEVATLVDARPPDPVAHDFAKAGPHVAGDAVAPWEHALPAPDTPD